VLTGGADIAAVVTGIVPAVPGAGDRGLLADLGTLTRAAFVADAGVPAATEQWLATSDPEGVADAVERDRTTPLIATTRADASSAPLIAPAVAALWTGAAGALLFAVVTVGALVAALAQARLGELVVLRVLGVPARLQARARFAELAASISTAALIGVVVGSLTALVCVRELARASVAGAPSALPIGLHLDVMPWLAGLAAFFAVVVAIGAGVAASVRRAASRPGVREEAG
jgi:hypothetical protein